MKALRNCVILLMTFLSANAQKKYDLLVGTYTNACKSDGIYVYDYDSATASATLKASSEKTVNPSYLAVTEDAKYLYSVNENGKDSKVTSFSLDAASGKLRKINSQDSQGADPCYIIADSRNVITANYSGGTISVFKRKPNGGLDPAAQVLRHQGSSVNKQRQESPHVHMATFSPDGKFVLANDLGTDRIYVYRYYPESERKVLEFQDTIPIKNGSGPRHLVFSPNGNFIFLLQELDGTLSSFSYADGKMRRIAETTVVQPGFSGAVGAADIHISDDGRFVYATNRGDANTISVFEVRPNGKLDLRQTLASGGKGPRNFSLSPDGRFVLVAHQYSNDIVVFSRDQDSGLLENTGRKIEVCSPVCIKFCEVSPR